jgi:hypothetical protein
MSNAQNLLDKVTAYLTKYSSQLATEIKDVDRTVRKHFSEETPNTSITEVSSMIDRQINGDRKFIEDDLDAMDKLWTSINNAKNTLVNPSDIDELGVSFYQLGYDAAIHQTASYGDMHIAKTEALQSNLIKQYPFRKKQQYRKTLKIMSQHIAKREWAIKHLKYGQMCVKVRAELIDWCLNQKVEGINIMNLLPKTDKTLKGWIKEVAPEEVKKPGYRD